ARDAGMVHGRHVDEKASGQRDVTGDARALLADRFLGDLNQDFLSFFQQIADQGYVGVFATRGSATTSAGAEAASTAASATSIELRTRGALGVACGCCGSADFDAGVHRAVAASFGVQQSLGFSLGV